jgi:cbb3-type cytochrome oxidase subunit 3
MDTFNAVAWVLTVIYIPVIFWVHHKRKKGE